MIRILLISINLFFEIATSHIIQEYFMFSFFLILLIEKMIKVKIIYLNLSYFRGYCYLNNLANSQAVE